MEKDRIFTKREIITIAITMIVAAFGLTLALASINTTEIDILPGTIDDNIAVSN